MSNNLILDSHIIYLITDGDCYKIGRTTKTNFYKRMTGLQTCNSREIKIICAVPSSNVVTESYVHAKFNRYRLRGEWFKKSPSIVKHFYKRWCKLYREVGYGCTTEFKLDSIKNVKLMDARHKKSKRLRIEQIASIKNKPLLFDRY